MADLDLLLLELKDAPVGRSLGLLYHYLPYIKLTHNLRLVVAAFLNGLAPADYTQTYGAIEAFKAIVDRKLAVSQPTLPVRDFYDVLLQEMANFVAYDVHNCWKVLPVITGIALANGTRDELNKYNLWDYGFYRTYDQLLTQLYNKALRHTLALYPDANTTNLALLSLAVHRSASGPRGGASGGASGTNSRASGSAGSTRDIFSTGGGIFSAGRGNSSTSLAPFLPKIINALVLLIFDPEFYFQDVQRHPTFRNLNRLAFLLEAAIQNLPVSAASDELIVASLTHIKLFAQAVSDLAESSGTFPQDQATALALKTAFFATCIAFQAVLSRFLNKCYAHDRGYMPMGKLVIESMYLLHFILESMGSGGFDSYNFSYYLSVEILFGEKALVLAVERMSMYMVGYPSINLHQDAINGSYINRSRLLFVLGLWENYAQRFHNDFVKKTITPLCYDIVGKSIPTEVIEAAHSVLLSSRTEDLIPYADLIIRQFPAVISANQLSIALETIGKRSGPDFLEFLCARCEATPSRPIAVGPRGGLGSGQPVAEIGAESSRRVLGVDVVKLKAKKPKDLPFLGGLDGLGRDGQREGPLGLRAHELAREMGPAGAGPAGAGPADPDPARVAPQTTREALVVSLINLVPYIEQRDLVPWLKRIMALVQRQPEEQAYLTRMLWKVVSENLDLARAEAAYRWWYGRGYAL